MSHVPIAALYPPSIYSRRSLACSASAPLTTKEIQDRHMKHIAEISKHLATEPIQSEELTFEQQEWLEFRMARPFPRPYRTREPLEFPYKWIEVDTI